MLQVETSLARHVCSVSLSALKIQRVDTDIVSHLSISRNIISPHTQFMVDVAKLLSSKAALQSLQSLRNNRLQGKVSTNLHNGGEKHRFMLKLARLKPSRFTGWHTLRLMGILQMSDPQPFCRFSS